MNTEQIQEIIARLTPLEQKGKEIVADIRSYLEETLPQVSIIEPLSSSFRFSFFGAVFLVRVELIIGSLRGYLVGYWIFPKDMNTNNSDPELNRFEAYSFDAMGNVYLGTDAKAHAEHLKDAVPQFVGSLVRSLKEKEVSLTPQ